MKHTWTVLASVLAFAGCSLFTIHEIHVEPYSAQTLPRDMGNAEVQAIYPAVAQALGKTYGEWQVTRVLARQDAFIDYVEYGIHKRLIDVFWAGRSKNGTCAVGLATAIQSSSPAGWAMPSMRVGGYMRRREVPGYKDADGDPEHMQPVGANSLLPVDCAAISQS